MRTPRGGDAGFTLPELMVAIVILGLIIVPISSAFIVGLLTTGEAHSRLAETQTTVLMSAFWAGDVQSADGTVTTGGSPACTNAGTNLATVATFRWADDISPTNAASYVVRSNTDSRYLVRFYCRGGSLVSQGTVAPELGAADPTVACTPTCNKPTRVTITMTTPKGATFTLNGTRRSTS
jgi:prepilin-type N-terminal cleavage/methylation domain-containing protein